MSRGFASEADFAPQRSAAPGRVGLGSRVTIRRGILMSDISIVAEAEADPSKGRIAATTPLARALEGAEPGDVIEIEAGGRIEEVRVLAVEQGEA